MTMLDDVCKRPTVKHDTDCPKCNAKNSLSIFEKTAFLVQFKGKCAYTKLVTFYTCNKCGHAYVNKELYQNEYDATLLSLKNKLKKETNEDKMRNISCIIAAILIPIVTFLISKI